MRRSILLQARAVARTPLPAALVVGLALLVMLFALRGCQTANDDVAFWKAKADAALNLNAQVVKQARKDSALVESHAKANALLASELAHTQALLRAAHAKRDTVWQRVVASAPDTCKPIIALAEGYRAEADTLDHALTTARGIIVNQTADIARLQGSNAALLSLNNSLVHLVKTAPIKPKLLGFIPLPSRTTSFIAGGVLGVAGAYLVLK